MVVAFEIALPTTLTTEGQSPLVEARVETRQHVGEPMPVRGRDLVVAELEFGVGFDEYVVCDVRTDPARECRERVTDRDSKWSVVQRRIRPLSVGTASAPRGVVGTDVALEPVQYDTGVERTELDGRDHRRICLCGASVDFTLDGQRLPAPLSSLTSSTGSSVSDASNVPPSVPS